MPERSDSSTPPPTPDDVIDPADLTVCSFCGETYDGSWADLSVFHCSNHTVTDAPHIRGERITEPPKQPPPPIPGRCNVVSFSGKRCVVPLGEHAKTPAGALIHRDVEGIFVDNTMTEEPGPEAHLLDPANDQS
jgi:hypothetical protein